jgi:hypothetical protein
MEFLFFLIGLLVGAVVMLAAICILAVGSKYENNEGDNQECTNQKQQ